MDRIEKCHFLEMRKTSKTIFKGNSITSIDCSLVKIFKRKKIKEQVVFQLKFLLEFLFSAFLRRSCFGYNVGTPLSIGKRNVKIAAPSIRTARNRKYPSTVDSTTSAESVNTTDRTLLTKAMNPEATPCLSVL